MAAPEAEQVVVRFPDAGARVLATRARDFGRGLQGCTFLPEGYGMLFDFGEDAAHGLWMRGVHVVLDAVFFSDRVVAVATMVPMTDDVHRAASRYVLEVPGGWAERNGVRVGQRVVFG